MRQHRGYFRQAHGGVVLLDQVESMPEPLQVMLLRVLEDGAIFSIGADRPQHVSVRMLATINPPAQQRMQEDQLRADLYDRLSASSLTIVCTRCGSGRSVRVSEPERQDQSPR